MACRFPAMRYADKPEWNCPVTRYLARIRRAAKQPRRPCAQDQPLRFFEWRYLHHKRQRSAPRITKQFAVAQYSKVTLRGRKFPIDPPSLWRQIRSEERRVGKERKC